jgi:hypothetical protein
MEDGEPQKTELHLLVGPHPPRIFSARRAPRRTVAATPIESTFGMTPRAPKRPKIGAQALPGEIPYQRGWDANAHARKLARQSYLITQVKGDQATVAAMQDKSVAYARSAAVKRTIHEQVYLDRFYIPLQYRIRDQLTPKKYTEFLKKKNAVIGLTDGKTIPVRSGRPVPKIPIVSVSVKGLHDPTFTFIEHQQSERKLSEFLARSNGEEITNQLMVKERDTVFLGSKP